MKPPRMFQLCNINRKEEKVFLFDKTCSIMFLYLWAFSIYWKIQQELTE